jgi:hypothetical protein
MSAVGVQHGIHVHVNNRFRASTEAAYNFRIPPMAFGISGVSSYLLQLKQVITQNFIPNVQQGVSDTFQVKYNGTTSSFTLAEGNYAIDDLVSAINTGLATLNAALQLTYDYSFQRLTIAVPAGTTFSWVSTSTNSTLQSFTLRQGTDRFLNMIGFIQQKNFVYTGAVNVTASQPVNLVPTSFLNIQVNQNMQVTNSDTANPQTIASVPLDVNYGDVIIYEPQQPRTFMINAQVMESMQITVTDEYGIQIKVPETTGLFLSWTLLTNSITYE